MGSRLGGCLEGGNSAHSLPCQPLFPRAVEGDPAQLLRPGYFGGKTSTPRAAWAQDGSRPLP